MKNTLLSAIDEAILAAQTLKEPQAISFMQAVAEEMVTCFQNGGKLLIAGNGGSLCDSMHFAEELTGQFRKKRKALPAIAFSDPGHLTCVSNDMGFEEVFVRNVEAFGREGDIFIALTTSGNSPNLVRAFQKAKELQLKTVAFLGKQGGTLLGQCDHEWLVQGFKTSDRIQEAHMAAIHIIIEQVERKLFSSLYEVEKVHEKMAKLSV